MKTIMADNIISPASTLARYTGGPCALALVLVFIATATYLAGIRIGTPIARRLLVWYIADTNQPISPKLDISVRMDLEKGMEQTARRMGIGIAAFLFFEAMSLTSSIMRWIEGDMPQPRDQTWLEDFWMPFIGRFWWTWVGGSVLLLTARVLVAAREGRWDDGCIALEAPQPFVGGSEHTERRGDARREAEKRSSANAEGA